MALTETHDYDDIINLPHHQSRRHAHMALSGRAAQFMPFAALTGYEDVLNRTVRVNEEAIARQRWFVSPATYSGMGYASCNKAEKLSLAMP